MSALNQGTGRRKSRSWVIAGAVVLGASMLWLYGCATTSASAEPVQVLQGTPEVQWSTVPDGNKTYLVDGNLRFKVPDEYFAEEPWTNERIKGYWEEYGSKDHDAAYIKSMRPSDYLGKMKKMVVNADDFKPSSPKIRECFSYNRFNEKCYHNTIQLTVDPTIRRTNYPYDESNYLNYYIEPDRAGHFYEFIKDPLTKKSEVYGLTRYHQPVRYNPNRSIKYISSYVENDIYLKLDGHNVVTHIRCTNSDIKELTYNEESSYPKPSECEHGFINKKLKIYIYIIYSREYLPHWRQIQDNATALIEQFVKAAD